MIVYNKSDLENFILNNEVKSLQKMKFLTKEKQLQISKKLESLKTSDNWFIRIGFLLLGFFLYSSIIGSLSFFILPLFNDNFKIIVFIYFIIGIVGAEILATQNYFKHGLDDAFIIGMQISLCGAIGIATENQLFSFITMIFVGLFCGIRYIHSISILSACFGVVLSVFYAVVEYHIFDALFLPFFGLLLAVVLFLMARKFSNKEEFIFYQNAIQLVKIFSYLLAYFSLNYYVVRELSQELLHIVVTKNKDIPFAYVFYVLTFLIPVLYCYFSLKNKNRILFYISILTFGFSLFTIRYYYAILPIEIALTIGGIVLFLIAYFAIKYLKNEETGITFQEDRNAEKSIFLDAQVLIINSQNVNATSQVPQGDMKFGGGGFSGGGANGDF